MCNIEKQINNFYKKYTECKDCNTKRRLKSYYENEDKISNQQKISFDEGSDKLLQKQNERYIRFKELLRNYVELQNRLKALEENFSKKPSKQMYFFKKMNRYM